MRKVRFFNGALEHFWSNNISFRIIYSNKKPREKFCDFKMLQKCSNAPQENRTFPRKPENDEL
jgi:hypothetical protein